MPAVVAARLERAGPEDNILNIELILVRTIHIGFGAVWFGAAVFAAAVLEPRLRHLGSEARNALLGSLMPAFDKVMNVTGTVTIVAGLYLMLRLRWNSLDTLHETDWGRSMSLALLVTVIAMGTGAMAAVNRKRMAGLAAAYGTPEETAQADALASKFRRYLRATVILLFAAVVMMAAARYA